MWYCKNCGSTNVQTRAWVGLNDESDIDYSLGESNREDDNWCKDCECHTEVTEDLSKDE